MNPMKSHIKNQIKYYVRFIILSTFLLAALLPRTALAEAKHSGSGILQKSESECAVKVSLSIPDGVTEKITTVHTHVYVDLQKGNLKSAPTFELSQSLAQKAVVTNTDIIKKTDNDYVLDIILSGIEDLFPDDNAVELGTLRLDPDAVDSEFQAEIGFDSVKHRDEDTDAEPSIEYVEEIGNTVMTLPLAYTDKVTITEGTSAPSTQTFNKPTMTVKLGGKYLRLLTFRWAQAEGADGYQIFQYDAASKKYKRLKTITGGEKLMYQKKFSYATDYQFKLRAFKTSASGKRTYGTYGPVIKVTTAPAAPANFRAIYANDTGTKVSLSWKKTAGATGYRIYRSDTVDGKYTYLKVVKKGTSTTDTQAAGTYHYYKIRAFRKDAAGNAVTGLYANKKAVWLKAPKATAKSSNRSKNVIVSWAKVPMADGYGIYQYDPGKKDYVLDTEVEGSDATSCTLTRDFNATYKFIVRARQIQNGVKVFGKASSAVKASTAPSTVSIKSVNSAEKGTVTVKWNKVSSADGYHIWRCTTKEGVYTSVADITGNTTLQFTDNNVESGGTYYYTVRAYRNTAQGTLLGVFSSRISVKVR